MRWERVGTPVPKRNGLAAFDFDTGTVILTEASKKRRASLKLVEGAAGLAALDPGGIDVLDVSLKEFSARFKTVNHTVKRALTDQHIFAGIGNAYSDEILLRARMSPFKQGSTLSDEETQRLYSTRVATCSRNGPRGCASRAGDAFPTKVTAFHDEMAVHGKFRQPCPVCGAPVQRIVYAENESNYCAKCQTAGRLLADRSLSRSVESDVAEAAGRPRVDCRDVSVERCRGLCCAARWTRRRPGNRLRVPRCKARAAPREGQCRRSPMNRPSTVLPNTRNQQPSDASSPTAEASRAGSLP